MTEVALIHDGVILSRHRAGSWVDLPNGDRVSPAEAGWAHADAGYALLPIVPVEVPPGQMAVGRALTIDGDVVVETAESFVDRPPLPSWLGGA